MLSKITIAMSALAVLANAAPTPSYHPYASAFCSSISTYATDFPHQSAGASSFCSSYFTISTSTTTTTTVSTTSVTSTYNTIAYTTTTPTSTVYTATSTCFTPTSTAVQKRAVTTATTFNPTATQSSAVSSASSQASAVASSYFSSACSCFGINVHPTATATATSTQTTYVATITKTTSTSTYTASAQTVSAAYTSYIVPSGQYVASDGTLYNEYSGYDFYGNDLMGTPCGPGNSVTVNGNTYPCQSFEDCENYCSEYNDGATGGRMCVAVSYAESYTFCYLKYAINDCNPVMNSNVEAGLAITAS